VLQRKIFVIEDDDVIRETMRELLELEGYEVITAANGQEALNQLDLDRRDSAGQPCLILLDLMMPVMSGGEFLATLVQSRPDVLRKSAVVVITAAADTFGARLPIQGLEVIQKPMEIDNLISIAERHCGRAQCC
jgi:CheY-like chemotaxis protein